MTTIEVTEAARGEFDVRVEEGGSSSRHRVTVSSEEKERFAPGDGVEDLVRESFRFLLEREPKEAILSRFELSTIERYFPDYPDRIRERLGA